MSIGRLRYKIALTLVWVANHIVANDGLRHVPYFRPVNTHMPGIGHEFACGAYSYEHLKSYAEQDGPDGPCAKTTVADFISEKGWRHTKDMSKKELRRAFAISGIDMDDDGRLSR